MKWKCWFSISFFITNRYRTFIIGSGRRCWMCVSWLCNFNTRGITISFCFAFCVFRLLRIEGHRQLLSAELCDLRERKQAIEQEVRADCSLQSTTVGTTSVRHQFEHQNTDNHHRCCQYTFNLVHVLAGQLSRNRRWDNEWLNSPLYSSGSYALETQDPHFFHRTPIYSSKTKISVYRVNSKLK